MGPSRAAKLFEANRTWASDIARNVARKLPPSFCVDDLMQVATIELWHRANAYRPDTNGGIPFRLYAWKHVYGAVMHATRDGNWRHATAASIGDDDFALQVVASPIERQKQRELLNRLVDGAGLSEDERSIIRLYFVFDVSLQEISKNTGIRMWSLNLWKRRGLEKLRNRARMERVA